MPHIGTLARLIIKYPVCQLLGKKLNFAVQWTLRVFFVRVESARFAFLFLSRARAWIRFVLLIQKRFEKIPPCKFELRLTFKKLKCFQNDLEYLEYRLTF